jgi:hypothetical protein
VLPTRVAAVVVVEQRMVRGRAGVVAFVATVALLAARGSDFVEVVVALMLQMGLESVAA